MTEKLPEDGCSPIEGINEELAKRDAELDMLEDTRITERLSIFEYDRRRTAIVLDFQARLKKACEGKREDMLTNPAKYKTYN